MATNSNVTFKNVVNATIHVDNSSDSDRSMSISADAIIYGSQVDSIQNGQCVSVSDPSVLVSFAASNGGYLSLTFNNMGDADAQVGVLREINGFISGVKESVPSLGMEC